MIGRKRILLQLLGSFFFLIFILQDGFAYSPNEESLSATFWTTVNTEIIHDDFPFVGLGNNQSERRQPESTSEGAEPDAGTQQEDPALRVLDEARQVFSGMMYGWSFRYVPENKARGYTESWETESIHEIPWGDPSLHLRQSWQEEHILYAIIDYQLNDEQQLRRRAWAGARAEVLQGSGEAPYYSGDAAVEQRQAAIQDAMRMAVREYLRARNSTPPREVTGRIILAEAPRITIASGMYCAFVRTVVQIHSYRPYEVF